MAGVICAIFVNTSYGFIVIPVVVIIYLVGWIYDAIQLARNNKRASAKFKFPD